MKLNEVSSIQVARTKTNMEEFNRVLGGGVVPGSLVLIGGASRDWQIHLAPASIDPTFDYWHCPLRVGEESAQQIKLRAERLGDIDSEFYLYAETNMQSIRPRLRR